MLPHDFEVGAKHGPVLFTQAAMKGSSKPDQGFRNAFHSIARRADSNEEIAILTFTKMLIEPANSTNCIGAKHHGRRHGPVHVAQGLCQGHRLPGIKAAENMIWMIGIEGSHLAVNHRAHGVLFHVLALHRKLLRQPDVVIIEQGDKLSAGNLNSGVPRPRQANVLFEIDDFADIREAIQISYVKIHASSHSQ